ESGAERASHMPGQKRRLVVAALEQPASRHRNRNHNVDGAQGIVLLLDQLAQQQSKRLGEVGPVAVFESSKSLGQGSAVGAQCQGFGLRLDALDRGGARFAKQRAPEELRITGGAAKRRHQVSGQFDETIPEPGPHAGLIGRRAGRLPAGGMRAESGPARA
ncbi:MAG TPA: hypothetical protein PLP17_06530, partial [Oligoflexia bacterium]|nr:hypothetical protein [Oligoflexia bacterium]